MAKTMSPEYLKYLRLLGEQFATSEALCTEITRLAAQLSLPKGTEHFMSDIHGEFEAFYHIMNNCSGVIKEKVHLWLGDQMTEDEIHDFCTLIYYPDSILSQRRREAMDPEWYRVQMDRLVYLARMLSSKYTREKVRRLIPQDWKFLIDELLHCQSDETDSASEPESNRRLYREALLDSVIATGSASGLITALTELVKSLAVDRLHVVGDIFDRGPRADHIMDILINHRSVDIEWGNHDILWMGAASGSLCCIAGVVRNCLAYGNTAILERGYGVPLRPLTLFAEAVYPGLAPNEAMTLAVTVMMFKLEGELILRHPEYKLSDRLLLHKIDREHMQITADGRTWPLKNVPLPTVDPDDAYTLTPEEAQIMDGLRHAFTHSQRLQEHISFLYRRGWMYRTFNGNLLFHGCVPLKPDGSFVTVTLDGTPRSGRGLMDYADQMARRAHYQGDPDALDYMWYLWCSPDSPVCGRDLKTFARAFIPDQESWTEPHNPYYDLYNNEEQCERILSEFGLTDSESRIINGHTPVRVIRGESPLKAGGRLVVIDGGFCRAYQKTTGIAGYTLISNSHGMRLMAHQPFTTLKDAQQTGRDIHSQSYEFAAYAKRKYVRDTDHGRVLQERMEDLLQLLNAYRAGAVSLQK